MKGIKIKKGLKGLIITFITILFMYGAITLYFMDRFYFGSEVNNISVAGKTIEEAQDTIDGELEKYTLKIIERNNKSDIINGQDILLISNSNNSIDKIKEEQKSYKWISSLFKNHSSEVFDLISYDESKLDEVIEGLNCFKEENIINYENPSYEYVNGEYKIIDEVKGAVVNKEKLKKEIKEAINKGKNEVNIEKCYDGPKYNKNSKQVIKNRDELNRYVSSNITIKKGDKEMNINSDIIKDWLSVDENLNVIIDKEKIAEYVSSISDCFNTVGKAREFKNSYGNIIQVSGGTYGWLIDKNEETDQIISYIKEGKKQEVEPAFYQKALSYEGNDIGNTYVEISLANQHLWFYKDGTLIVEGDVVTGNVANNCATPAGVYFLAYKERNAVLRGEGYESNVSFWMPFNNGIGIHDATWRGAFGGQIYMNGGSHGCVNAPYNLANTIFNNIEAGMPIICY